MKRVILSERVPIKMWLDDIEEGALAQAKNLANLPFTFKHVAIMPDAHQGYGMPIGGVLATDGVVIPNAVGVDIGCGMCALKTPLTYIDIDSLRSVMGKIREYIPVGFGRHKEKQGADKMPAYDLTDETTCPIVYSEWDNAEMSIGTLGGGNHFIEIQKGSDGFIWVMVHSGSRNLGYKVAKHYNDSAIRLNSLWHSAVPRSHELAFLPIDTFEAQLYMAEMNYCVKFAFANRKLMMSRIIGAFESVFPNEYWDIEDELINIAHNYAQYEHHFGKNVIVHRKGATQARDGQIGIIPGSQGTKSYIVRGKGNPQSFMSCSHGAGRKMGRKQAQRELNLDDEVAKMEGILHSVRGKKDLDEAPGAYKDIDVVMANQADLVDIVIELTPIGVIKG